MSSDALKVIVLGLGEGVDPLLEAMSRREGFSIKAVSDANLEHAEATARRYECAVFDDTRQLIIQSQADILVVGSAVHLSAEQIRLAVEKDHHIFKVPPAGLNFEQAAEWIRSVDKRGRRFVLIQPGRYHPLLGRFGQIVQEAEANTWHLISAVCHEPNPPEMTEQRWRYDPSLAGGGVLLQNAYSLIDELVLCFGVPQQVYTQTTNQAPDRQQRMSLTEDTAVVIMRFSDTLVAHVSASRTLGPRRKHLRVHGKDRFITLLEEELTVSDHEGQELEQMRHAGVDEAWAGQFLDNFVNSLQPSDRVPPFPPPDADLKTMAVLEAAYLSVRTGMPEQPARILRLSGLELPEF